MVLSANDARTYVSVAATLKNANDLNTELMRLETKIRQAANALHSKIVYNASIIGNPYDDPHVDSNLTDTQKSFRDSLINSGYVVGIDEDTKYWLVSWEGIGAENLVSVYILYTTVSPGAVENQTIEAIHSYFSNQTPVITSRVNAVTINGGDIDETTFGADDSVFYQYIIMVEQPNTTDHSEGIMSAVVAAGAGYDDTEGSANLQVYKVA